MLPTALFPATGICSYLACHGPVGGGVSGPVPSSSSSKKLAWPRVYRGSMRAPAPNAPLPTVLLLLVGSCGEGSGDGLCGFHRPPLADGHCAVAAPSLVVMGPCTFRLWCTAPRPSSHWRGRNAGAGVRADNGDGGGASTMPPSCHADLGGAEGVIRVVAAASRRGTSSSTAPFTSNTSATRWNPNRTAMANAVRPLWFLALMSTPRLIRILAAATLSF